MRTLSLITIGAAIALLLLFGCPKDQPPPPAQKAPPSPPPFVAELPVSMVLTQRTTTAVPGSEGAVQVTIDDITRGQVMASLASSDGEPLLAPKSLEEGESASFDFKGRTYYLTLQTLSNELIGDDSALLVLDDQPPPDAGDSSAKESTSETTHSTDTPDNASAPSEAAQIRQLIAHIRSLEGAVFIRNGEEHTAVEAAEHLQRKWDFAGDKIQTAEQFIDELASKSSTTGEDYLIRLNDGTEIAAGAYLRQQREKLPTGGQPGNDN
ncbi:MAG TPA: DUF5329 family protein [Lacipirellula sp.]